MVSSRTHAPGAEGAPLLASDLESTLVKPPLGRADRDRVSSARLFGGVAIALLVACVGAVGSIAVAARASGGAGAVVTSASALGSVAPVDPMEASGARPMSAYGTIDRNSPVMRDLAAGEDPVERAAALFLEDATLGEREEPAAARDEKDAAPRDAPTPRQNQQQQPRDEQQPRNPQQPQTQQPSSPARSVQDEVDDQIEIEMRRLDEAARAMDAERATARRAREDGETPGTNARRGEDETAGRSRETAPRETALLAGGKRGASSRRDRRSRDDPKDEEAPVKDRAPMKDEAPVKDEASKPRPVVSEVKDGYARAIDAALASGSIGAGREGVSSDLSSLNVLEPVTPASSDRGVFSNTAERGVPSASGACDFSRCDAAAGPQVVDESCVSMGGLGCIGQTGCRFCKAGAIGELGLATCPPCVCQAMGVTGCGDATAADDDVFQSGGVGKAEASTASTASTSDFDDGVPVNAAERVIAAPAALTTEGAVVAPPEALLRPEDVPADAAPAATATAPFSVAGVAWLLTPFGYLETCEQRCARAKMRCDDTKFPSTFQDFVSVVGATNPEPGRDDVCASVLETDPSRHCVFPLYALSGRCYQQPARAPSCVTAEDAHADCQHFCPCVK